LASIKPQLPIRKTNQYKVEILSREDWKRVKGGFKSFLERFGNLPRKDLKNISMFWEKLLNVFKKTSKCFAKDF